MVEPESVGFFQQTVFGPVITCITVAKRTNSEEYTGISPFSIFILSIYLAGINLVLSATTVRTMIISFLVIHSLVYSIQYLMDKAYS